MARQHEITSPKKLLNLHGDLMEPGYAKKLLWQYSRQDIKAPAWRIKEWDYYYIGCQEFGLALTLSDAGMVSNLAASILEFGEHPHYMTDGAIGAMPLGKLHLPNISSQGSVSATVNRAKYSFINRGDSRHLRGTFRNFNGSGQLLSFDITLTDIPEESMVIATPFDKKKHFYYNQKINGMRAEGHFSLGSRVWHFTKENKALATLDWGRGVWTYDNTWYWGSGQTVLDNGKVFGFNIGYGFGDTSAATENMLFYDGKAHKLDEVTFNIPKDEQGNYIYLKPWTFTSNDGRFEMDFRPVLDRYEPVDFKLLAMIPHQVFGYMSGRAVLDDGMVIEIRDRLVFAEVVHNKW